MHPIRTGVLLVPLALAALAPAPPPAPAQGAAGRTVVMDFESAEQFTGGAVVQQYSEVQQRPDPDGGGSLCGKWIVPAGEKAGLWFLSGPKDLTPYRILRFRIRRESESSSGLLFVRLMSDPTGEIFARLPGVGTGWRTVELELDRLPVRGAFDPRHVKEMGLFFLRPGEGVYWVDDFELDGSPSENAGKDPREEGDAFLVDDFEDPAVETRVEFKGGRLEVVDAGGRGGGRALRWTIEGGGGKEPAAIYFFDVPRDITRYRSVKFRLRNEGRRLPGPLAVKLLSGFTDGLTWDVPDPGSKWTEVTVELPRMREQGRFDPARFDNLGIYLFRPQAATLLLDDLRLEKAPGGWEWTAKERMEVIFGKGRASRGRSVETDHFELFSDARAALSKFPKALEEAYAFVRDRLGTGEMKERLPVFVFQNPSLFRDYLVREEGYDREDADGLDGIGTARFFATFYRSPDDSQVVHELAHSLHHRLRGREGGSWFQEGVAQDLEMLWLKKSAAADFAPRLRRREFLPLAEFLVIPKLHRYEGRGARIDDLFLQAAAFHEFLRRGPLAEKWREVAPILAVGKVEDRDRVASVEALMDMELPDLERAWLEWGREPPEAE